MNLNDKDIDRLFKDASLKQSFEYKSDFFDEIVDHLPLEESKKKRPFLLYYISGTVAAGIALFIFFNFNINNYPATKHLSEIESENNIEQLTPAKKVNERFVESNTKIMTEQNTSPFINISSKEEIKIKETKQREFHSIVNKPLVNTSISSLPLKKPNLSISEFDEIVILNHPKIKKRKTIFVELFTGIQQSLSTQSNKSSESIGIGVGFNQEGQKFALTGGIRVLASSHNDLQLTRSAKVYGFSSELYKYDFDFKELYQTELNLELAYKFGRNKAKIGLRPSYTVSSRVEISETRIENNSYEAITANEVNQYYGYKGGISQFGLKPSVGYGYNFGNSFEVGASASIQLIKQLDNDFYEGSIRKNPIEGQIYLRKHFRI